MRSASGIRPYYVAFFLMLHEDFRRGEVSRSKGMREHISDPT